MLDTLARAYVALGSDADRAGMKRLASMVRGQALVMSFSDVFLVLTCLFVGMAMLTPLVRRPKPLGAAAGGH